MRGEAQRYRGEARSSAGSVESPRRVDRGEMHLAVVSSGHACLGREGLLENDEKRYEDALAVACPYGAPARRVVCRGAGRERPRGLVGKKVGVGSAGSGAFANRERRFGVPGFGPCRVWTAPR